MGWAKIFSEEKQTDNRPGCRKLQWQKEKRQIYELLDKCLSLKASIVFIAILTCEKENCEKNVSMNSDFMPMKDSLLHCYKFNRSN